MGELTPVGRALGILEGPETLSIFASTRRLFEARETFIAVVLTLASIVIPLAKLVVVNRALLDACRSAPITPWLSRTSNLTKYSLTDVFVVAVFIVCFKSFPGGTEISHHWGLWAFAAAATLPWIIAFGLAPRRAQPSTCTPPPRSTDQPGEAPRTA
jgi:uncharacterized paraquat-inducible protein A